MLLKKRYVGIEKQRRNQLKISLVRIEKKRNEQKTIKEYLIKTNEILELMKVN